ncbi:class II fructose-bisphosphate aldolase [Ekhidna sp.]|uniref:class II fructose-bisphosphate aldolase n=1 Tax=Ekhidna sp. TaxID=2608089 RepID=UPI003CCBF06C
MSNLKSVISQCFSDGKSLLAFNIQNISHLAILEEVSRKYDAPVIAQISQKYIKFFDNIIGLKHIVDRYQSDLLFFHLDHCSDKEIIETCIHSGFASVMFDGSHTPLSENIKNSNEIFKIANDNDCLLEVELGSIGGVEDGFGTEESDVYSESELLDFTSKTKYDMLALAIGNAHGFYKSTKSIDIDLLKKARDLSGDQFFVLHGGTGMPDKMIAKAISYGVIKINVSTALKVANMESMKKYLHSEKEFNESKYHQYLGNDLSTLFSDYIKKFTL